LVAKEVKEQPPEIKDEAANSCEKKMKPTEELSDSGKKKRTSEFPPSAVKRFMLSLAPYW